MEAALKREYILDNLCCPKCAAKIEKHIAALEGVRNALVDFPMQKLTIEVNEAKDAGRWDDIMTRARGIIKGLEPSIELRNFALSPKEEADGGNSVPVSEWLRRGSFALGIALFAAGMAFD
jgi:Cd2+/Zn2+-exporting ATPase